MSEQLQTLEQLHAAIVAGLAVKLAGVPVVAYYPPDESALALPAVLIELNALTPGRDPGTGAAALVARFQARVLADAGQAQTPMRLRELAARLALALKNESWGLPVGLAQFVQAAPGALPEAAGRLAWLVEWTHEFELGEAAWPYPDSTGLTLMLGLDPDTGAGRESQYWPAGAAPAA